MGGCTNKIFQLPAPRSRRCLESKREACIIVLRNPLLDVDDWSEGSIQNTEKLQPSATLTHLNTFPSISSQPKTFPKTPQNPQSTDPTDHLIHLIPRDRRAAPCPRRALPWPRRPKARPGAGKRRRGAWGAKSPRAAGRSEAFLTQRKWF